MLISNVTVLVCHCSYAAIAIATQNVWKFIKHIVDYLLTFDIKHAKLLLSLDLMYNPILIVSDINWGFHAGGIQYIHACMAAYTWITISLTLGHTCIYNYYNHTGIMILWLLTSVKCYLCKIYYVDIHDFTMYDYCAQHKLCVFILMYSRSICIHLHVLCM